MLNRRTLFAVLMVMLIISACDAPPEGSALCYTFNFVTMEPQSSAGSLVNIQTGEWVSGVGLKTDAAGDLVFNWSEPKFFYPEYVSVQVGRPEGSEGDIYVQFAASAFSIDLLQDGTIPSAENLFTIGKDNTNPTTTEGNAFNATVQAAQPIVIRYITVYVNEPSPFPRNDCGPETPTETPTTTPSPSPTAGTPTITPTPNCQWYMGFGEWSLTPQQIAYPQSISYNFPNQYITKIRVRIGRDLSVPAPAWYVDGVYKGTISNVIIGTGGGNKELIVNDFASSISFGFPYFDDDGKYYFYDMSNWMCFGPPTATPTATTTLTLTPTRTPTLGASPTRTPLITTPLPTSTFTPTNIILSTRTPLPSFTPPPTNTLVFPTIPPTQPPTLTRTPRPTTTPPPTSTPHPLPTEIQGTVTPWGTYPGADLTPLPGGTPDFEGVGTPVVGTLVGTPQPGSTTIPVPDDLSDFHDGITSNLGTAVAQVNDLPRDITQVIPEINNLPEFAGQAKWIISGVSLQEIFGQRIYPIPLHMFYGITAILFVSTVMLGVRIALLFIKLATWVIRFILKIIPFIG